MLFRSDKAQDPIGGRLIKVLYLSVLIKISGRYREDLRDGTFGDHEVYVFILVDDDGSSPSDEIERDIPYPRLHIDGIA